ncbi:MAG: hypothetical protein Q8L98_02060 [Chlamydiales bacterium]|nr:hypothetical protein [Chlamydiales bacterium]
MRVTLGSKIGTDVDRKVDRLNAYTRYAPETFQKILDNWEALETTSLCGTEYEPKPLRSRRWLDENDIFDACTKSPEAISWYLSQEGHFYLCLKLIENTSKEVYTLRFVDGDNGGSGVFSSHKSFKMELWDANGRKCDKTVSGLRWYDCEIPGILDIKQLLYGEAVILASWFYEPEKGSHSFSLAS